jgi:hypothetical protein
MIYLFEYKSLTLTLTVIHFATTKAKAIFVLHFTEILHPEILDATAMLCINNFCMKMYIPTHLDRVAGSLSYDAFDDKEEERAGSYGYGSLSVQLFSPLFILQLGTTPSSDGIASAKHTGKLVLAWVGIVLR